MAEIAYGQSGQGGRFSRASSTPRVAESPGCRGPRVPARAAGLRPPGNRSSVGPLPQARRVGAASRRHPSRAIGPPVVPPASGSTWSRLAAEGSLGALSGSRRGRRPLLRGARGAPHGGPGRHPWPTTTPTSESGADATCHTIDGILRGARRHGRPAASGRHTYRRGRDPRGVEERVESGRDGGVPRAADRTPRCV